MHHIPVPYKNIPGKFEPKIVPGMNLSVEMLMIDSASAGHLHRRMHSVLDYLSTLSREPKPEEKFTLYEFLRYIAIFLNRYHSVGKNTRPNINSMLNGISMNKKTNYDKIISL